jgi:hypothetical protein
MSDTFIKIVQDIKNNVKGTILGAKVEHVAGDLVEVKIFSLAADAGDRKALWKRLPKSVAQKPYKSLEPYTIKDSQNFFGRDKVLVDILTKLTTNNVIAVFGRAGIGKTSLIDAGVAPLIIQEGGLLVSISNYDNPAQLIQQALKGLTSESNAAADSAGEDVADTPDDKKAELRKLIKGKIEPGSLLLVLDQFELLFEPTITTVQREAFITDLKDLFAAFPDNPPKVIIVARDEVKAGLADFQEQLPDLFEAVVDVPLLDEEDALKAISEPLLEHVDRVQFESLDVVKMVAKHLASQQGDEARVYPPHLQIVCCSLYDEAVKQSPFTITRDLFTRSKFAEGIIARFLELRLDNQLGNVKESALELLIQLASPGQYRWVSPNALTLKADPPESSVAGVLEKMVSAKLLYRQYANNELRYGFIDAGMANRVLKLAGEEIEEQNRARAEMERMWQAWLARDVFATSEQLDYISRNQSHLQLPPLRIMLLLRSAIERNENAGEWVKLLGTEEGSALIADLETELSPSASTPTVEFAWELLTAPNTSTNGSSNGAPLRRFTKLSAGAADGPDDITRATAALALMSRNVGAAVGEIDAAIAPINDWSKRIKRVKLRSAMVEANAAMKDINATGLLFLDRLLVFLWLVFKRAYYHDASRILQITASAALCSGLLVVTWGELLARVMTRSGSGAFTVLFTNGAFLGGGIALGLSLVKPLIQVHKVTGQFTGAPAKAVVIICMITFGLLHCTLQYLTGAHLFSLDNLFLTGMGFIFGSGIGIGLMSDFDQQGSVTLKWNWRYVSLAGIIFFIIPLVFVVFPKSERGGTLHLAIITGGDFFSSDLNGLSGLIDKVFVHGETVKLRVAHIVPMVYHFVSAIDSVVTGLLLILGFKLGVRLSNKA